MPEQRKSKSELLREISVLRRRVAEFERVTRDRKRRDVIRSNRPVTRANPRGANLLTRAEMEVLRLIMDGKSNKEVASTLHRSVRTIEVHRSHMMRKLGVDNVVDLLKQAAALGLVDLPAPE